MRTLTLSIFIVAASVSAAVAEVSLPALFADHMVLQRNKANPVWGWADPGETITVTFDGVSVETTTLDNGAWVVRLPEAELGDARTLTVAGSNTITINDVLVGDVWVCSGQSNMQWTVAQAANPEEEAANAKYPNIRYFGVPLTVALTPQSDVAASWVQTSPEVASNFSAVAYFFGRTLHRELDVPIGLIATSWGGTAIESWISPEATAISETFFELKRDWARDVDEHGDLLLTYYDRVTQPRPELPEMNRQVGSAPNVPSFNYHAMIAPLWQYGIKGAIWYQGESNASRAYQYRDLMKTMIRDWRIKFGQGEFPFFITQLANFRERAAEPGESDWAELREAQLMATELSKVGMAVTIDIGDADDIHPKNKQEVGRRLAQSALNIAHGMDVVPSGPVYEKMRRRGKSIALSFDHGGGGLVSKENSPLSGFQIAGEDQEWVWAEAKIVRKTVRVRSKSVSKPVAVRYGWANNPDCNLYNAEGFPATPFRTDDWPISTQD